LETGSNYFPDIKIMAMETKLQLRQVQKLVMTTELRNAIKLLTLSRLELQQLVQEKLLENPCLEEDNGDYQEETEEALTIEREEKDENQIIKKDKSEIEFDFKKTIKEENWEEYSQSYQDNLGTNYNSDYQDDPPQLENILPAKVTLTDYLTSQLQLVCGSKEELEIGTIIIGNLDENGYLATPLTELIEQNSLNSSLTYKVHGMIKEFEPEGIGSQNLQECLLTQVNQRGINNPLVIKIITDHMQDLQSLNFKKIARFCQVTEDKVVEVLRVIRTLEPKPARNFVTEETDYVIPDIYVVKVDGKYVVYLNDDGLSNFKFSPFYKEMLSRKSNANNTAKLYVDQQYRSAVWLLKTIQQRRQTIYKVATSIVNRQKGFFDQGISHLKPMVLREVAKDVSLHECTVSRVVTHKYMYTPRGLFELKYFFTSGVTSTEGNLYSSITVKNMMKNMITGENKEKPFSDKRIVQLMKDLNINLARRTIAKYREELGILPSGKRKETGI